MDSQLSLWEYLLPQDAATTTARHVELKRFRLSKPPNSERIAFNKNNYVNQINYRHNQGGLKVVTEDF